MRVKKYIKRQLYLDKVNPYINKNIIKVIVGQRRVGKSYMLYQIMDVVRDNHPNANVIYINKELHEFKELNDDNDLMAYIKSKTIDTKKNYLFIDEIQDIQQFENALRSLQAEDDYDIYCTGSNARLLSGELSSYLSGRYVEIKVFGLSYIEFLQFHSLEDTKDSFFKYIKFGGLPYLINLKLEDNIVYDYLKNIYSAILFKDVVARHNIRNIAFLENLISYLADNTGSIVSAKKISDFLKSQNIKISPNVVLNYLSYLQSAFFIFKVQRAEIEGKKIFEIGEKYYFEDLGLRHSIIGYKQTDIGKILENLVFLHLKISGYNITVGTKGNREIDFVCERSGEKLYVQVAYLIHDQKTQEREFGNLLKIKDNHPKIVLSMDEMIGDSYKGINHINIRTFFKQYS